MKIPSIFDYLTNKGLLDGGSKADIEAAKKERRREYLKQKKKEFRATHRTVSLSFTNAEMKQLEREAAAHNMKVPQYLRACIYAAREQSYIVPDVDKVEQLEILLKRISTHTNQIARLANGMSMPPVRAIKEIQEHIKFFEKTFDVMFRNPKNLEQVIREELKENSSFAAVLMNIITSHLTNK